MFCQYCGKPNPDDSSFCSACGKNIAWTPASSERSQPKAAPPEPVHVVSEAEERLVRTILAPEPKKDRWKLPPSLGVLATIAIILMLLPHKDGPTVCQATRNTVAQQVPFAVEILAARHPLTVGVVRSLANTTGFVDKLAEVYVENEMIPRQDPGAASCYVAYYTVMFGKDRVRSSIADWIEAKLQLK